MAIVSMAIISATGRSRRLHNIQLQHPTTNTCIIPSAKVSKKMASKGGDAGSHSGGSTCCHVPASTATPGLSEYGHSKYRAMKVKSHRKYRAIVSLLSRAIVRALSRAIVSIAYRSGQPSISMRASTSGWASTMVCEAGRRLCELASRSTRRDNNCGCTYGGYSWRGYTYDADRYSVPSTSPSYTYCGCTQYT